MITENNKKFLRKISFLENFTDDELTEFFHHLSAPIKRTVGQALINDGATDSNLYIILSGEFSVYKKTNLKNNFIAKMGKAEVIGEISEYVGEKRSVSVVVSTPEAKVLKVEVKRYPLHLRLKIRENYCNILAKRFISRNDEFIDLRSKIADIISNCEERVYKAEEIQKAEIETLKNKIAEQEKLIKSLRATQGQ